MLPLQGLRILSVEQYGAGPYGSMQIADLGGEVIKIERPDEGGDMARGVGPYYDGAGESLFFHSFNRNKRSIALDLRHPEGRRVFEALVRDADAVLNNLRGDLPEKLGLTYATLGRVNPRIVCTSLSAYGREVSRRDWPGYDYLMQAEAGYLSLTGEPGTPPARFGLSIVDMMSGLFAAFALLAGVLSARATGQGRDIDVSLFDCALQNLNYLATWYLNCGHVQGREPASAHPSLTPSQLYPTADHPVFIMCNKEKFWPALCDALDMPELAGKDEFRRFPDRLRNRDRLNRILSAKLRERGAAEWLERFAGRVPAAPVNDVAAALAGAHVEDSAQINRYAAGSGAEIRMVRAPFRLPGEPLPQRAGPRFAADTEALLAGLGLDAEAINRLARIGVISLPQRPSGAAPPP